jgi:hypothetical protein
MASSLGLLTPVEVRDRRGAEVEATAGVVVEVVVEDEA